MNEKTFDTLELPKILAQLARHTSFSASHDLALSLTPTPYLDEAQDRQQETSEARLLFEEKTSLHMGGIFDVRPAVNQAMRGIIIEPSTLLDVLSTLRRATTVRRILTRLRGQFPRLAQIADLLEECTGLQEEIARVVNDKAEINDSASPKLATLRRDMRIAFDRLQSKLQGIVNNGNNAKYLQEPIITTRNGRYVVPLKAEFKGRIKGIVHDQSASGATLWIEPLSTVEQGNQYRQLQLEEEDEIRRILRALTDLIGHEAIYITRTVEVLAELDLILAKARYAEEIEAQPPRLVGFHPPPKDDDPYFNHPGSTIKLTKARHPLIPVEEVVPIDVLLDDETYALVITGPNTGGKTVALKTVGLLVLMAQCGLQLPTAEGPELSVFEGVFADIGDEQSIEQSLSTFSSHMTNTINILRECGPNALVILDEVGAGTDPAEGAALARAILKALLQRGSTTLVTTHHPELKIWSHEQRGVRNASVIFDLETLAPTYKLVIGLPGRSNALAIAERLGLEKAIVEDARQMVPVDSLVADDLLDEIHRSREEIRLEQEAAEYVRGEADKLRRDLQGRLDRIEEERRDLLNQARAEAEAELDEVRAEMRRLRRELQAAGQPLEAIRQAQELADDIEYELAAPLGNVTHLPGEEEDVRDRTFRLGDLVWVHPLNAEGEIIELSEAQAELQIGRLRLRTSLEDISPRSRGESKRHAPPPPPPVRTKVRKDLAPSDRPKSPGLELDLRGSRVDEASERLGDYLDAAYMSGLPFVRIIHGKGTGALREAVTRLVQDHPLVRKWERGKPKEGGDGVTIVHMVQQH